MGSSENSMQPIVHKFGDEELSDVTFIVGGEEFKCHKMTLASRSTYFKAMFYSNFKEKDQDKVSIEADPVAFKWFLELMYTGQFTDWAVHLSCPSTVHGNPGVTLWKNISATLNLADQFDVLNLTVSLLENYLIRCGDCPFYGNNCCINGAKLLIALKYGMEEYKKKFVPTRDAVFRFLGLIKKEQPDFSLEVSGLQWILKMA